MINGIHLASLRNSEFSQFITDVLGIVSANNPAALNIAAQYDALLAANAAVSALFKSERGSALTAAIEQLDARRDSALTGISQYVDAMLYHFDPVMRGHAEALSYNLKLYGNNIARQNYQSETAIITNMTNDWNSDAALTSAITALNLGAWRDELVTANTLFSEQYLLRTQEMGTASPETIQSRRKEAGDAYFTLRDFLVSYNTINLMADPYNRTVNELNALIDQYNSLLANRKNSGTHPEGAETDMAEGAAL